MKNKMTNTRWVGRALSLAWCALLILASDSLFAFAQTEQKSKRGVTRRAVIIGTQPRPDAIGGMSPTDARAVADVLSRYGYATTLLYENSAKREAIRSELDSILRKLESGDTLVVYIGLPLLQKGESYLVPYDSTIQEVWQTFSVLDFAHFVFGSQARSTFTILPSCDELTLGVSATQNKLSSDRQNEFTFLSHCPPKESPSKEGFEQTFELTFARILSASPPAGKPGWSPNDLFSEISSQLPRSYGIRFTNYPYLSGRTSLFVSRDSKLAPLLDELQSSDSDSRAKALQKMVTAVREEPNDTRDELEREVVKAALGIATAIQEDSWVRSNAVRALGILQSASTADSLGKLYLESKDEKFRVELIGALTQISSTSASKTLLTATQDPSSAVRIGAAQAANFRADPVLLRAVAEMIGKDPDEDVRVAALIAVSSIKEGGREFRTVVTRALSDKSASVRREAVSALVGMGEFPSILQRLLTMLQTDGSPIVRESITYSFGRGFKEQYRSSVEPALIELSRSDVVDIRAAAAWSLGELKGPRAEAALLQLLEGDQAERVQRNAIESLERMQSSQAAGALLPFLNNRSSSLRYVAAHALGIIGGASVRKALSELASNDEDSRVRQVAGEALAKIEAPDRGSLEEQLRDSSPKVRSEATRQLGRFGLDGVAGLLRMLGDEDYQVRRTAVDVLSSLTPTAEIVAAIAVAFRDEDFRRREGAVTAIGNLKQRDSVPLVLPLTRDSSSAVRAEAVRAIGKLASREQEKVLLDAAADRDAAVRAAAAEGLARSQSATAVSRLRELASDPAPEVSSIAIRALRKSSAL